jgi:hypothetical protein
VFMPRLNSGLAPCFEERLDPFVLKTLLARQSDGMITLTPG